MDVHVYLDEAPRIEIDSGEEVPERGARVFFRLHWPGDEPLNLQNGWVYFRYAINGAWTDGIRWPEEGGHTRLIRTTQSLIFTTRLDWRPDDVVTVQASVQAPGFSVMEATPSFTIPRPSQPDLEAYNADAVEAGEPEATGFEWDTEERRWVPVLTSQPEPDEVAVWTLNAVYTQPQIVRGPDGTPEADRRWALQTATETASAGREPWQGHMWAVWQEVT